MTPDAARLDADDPLAPLRALFSLPDDVVYLDGNSLGALPKHVSEVVGQTIRDEWGRDLIASWNKHAWIELPEKVGERIAPLIGAAPGQVVCVDSISVNLFKLLSVALSLQKDRSGILCIEDDFPTDGYMAEGLAGLLGEDRCSVRRVPAEDLVDAIDNTVAVLMLTQVNYRTGACHDMAALTAKAQERGALVLWDLAHSAGAMEVYLDATGADMAVGCGYKYFNGGPGAPAFVYLNARHQGRVQQPLAGWLGHRKPFAFDAAYEPAPGVLNFQAGTPPIISMVALNAALDVFDQTTISDLRSKSLALTDTFIGALESRGLLSDLVCVTPREHAARGSQVSLRHDKAWGISQALIEAGVIVDFRAPDIVRFGFAPLYNRFADAEAAARVLSEVMAEERYEQARFENRPTVT